MFPRTTYVAFAPADERGGDEGDNFQLPEQTGQLETNDQGESQALDNFIEQSDLPDDSSSTSRQEGTPQEGQEGRNLPAEGQQQNRESTTADQQHQQGQENRQARGPQDLVLNDGTVIKGGPERRLYEKNQRTEQQLQRVQGENQQMQQQLQEANGKVQAYEQAFASAKNYGVSPQEADTAHRLIAAYKRDPVGTINYLLTEAKAAGHDTNQIGGAGVDTNAIQRVVAEQLKPLTDRYRAEEQQTQQQQEAEREAQQFFQRYPDAATHEQELSQLLDRRPDLSPDAAYFALREYYAKNGMDFRYPLSAYQQQQGAQGQDATANGQSGQPQPAQQSIPTGRGNGAASSAHAAYDPTKSNSEGQEWDDIIGSAMREAGIGTY